MATAKHGRESIEIAAGPADAYDLVADITPMGEWSPERYRCEWLDRATKARDEHDSAGTTGWAATGGRRPRSSPPGTGGASSAFTVLHDGTGREETARRCRFEPSSGGTLLTESFEFLWCPLGNRVIELFTPRGSRVNRGIHRTLQRIATLPRLLRRPQVSGPINRRRAPDRYASPDSAR